jgi:translation initiation factor 2-alpha kinase 4
MKRLFSLRESGQLDNAYDMEGNKSPDIGEALIRSSVFEKAQQFFRLHGAINLDTPLLVPSTTMRSYQDKNIVNLVDEAGTIVMLPFNHTLPFARYIAQNKITNLRRYSLAKVYRKGKTRCQPREIFECDFDIGRWKGLLLCVHLLLCNSIFFITSPYSLCCYTRNSFLHFPKLDLPRCV